MKVVQSIASLLTTQHHVWVATQHCSRVN